MDDDPETSLAESWAVAAEAHKHPTAIHATRPTLEPRFSITNLRIVCLPTGRFDAPKPDAFKGKYHALESTSPFR